MDSLSLVEINQGRGQRRYSSVKNRRDAGSTSGSRGQAQKQEAANALSNTSLNSKSLRNRKQTPLSKAYINQIYQVCDDFQAIEGSKQEQILNINISSIASQRFQTLKPSLEHESQYNLAGLEAKLYTNNIKFKQLDKSARDKSQKNMSHRGEDNQEHTFRMVQNDEGENHFDSMAGNQSKLNTEFIKLRHAPQQSSIETSQLISYNTSNLMSHLSLNNNTQYATLTPGSGTVSRPSYNSRIEKTRKVRNKSGFNTTTQNAHNPSSREVEMHYMKHPYNQPVMGNNYMNVSEARPIKIKMKNVKIKHAKHFPNHSENFSNKGEDQTSPQNTKLLKIRNEDNTKIITQSSNTYSNHLATNPFLSNRQYQQWTDNSMANLQVNQPQPSLGATHSLGMQAFQVQNSIASAGNTSQLEKMIKDMLVVKEKERDSAQTIVGLGQTIRDHQLKEKKELHHTVTATDSFNLNSFLDIQILPQTQKLRFQNQDGTQNNPVILENPQSTNASIFSQTIAAQRQDFQALSQIERSWAELQARIKQRDTVLRSFSRRHQRRAEFKIPNDLIAHKRIQSNSNVRPSTIRNEFQPYHQTTQSLNLIRGGGSYSKTSRRNKRQNETTLNPSQAEFYSGRITSLKGNISILNQSPTVMNQTTDSQLPNYSQQLQYPAGQNNASVISGATDETVQNFNSSLVTYNINGSQPNIIISSNEKQGSIEGRKNQQKDDWISIQVQNQDSSNGRVQNRTTSNPIAMSNKKINRIQRKKIVIHDNFNSLQRDFTPIRNFEGTNKAKSNHRLGPGNHSSLRQRVPVTGQQGNLRSVSTVQRHQRTKSVGHNQKRSVLPATQYYQIQQYKLKAPHREGSSESKTAGHQRYHSLSPPATVGKGNLSPSRLESSFAQQDFENRKSQGRPRAGQKFSNLLQETPVVNITMMSEEFKMDRNKINKSRRDLRPELNLNLSNTANSIQPGISNGQSNGFMAGGITNSSTQNKSSLNFNIRQKLNFRYIPDEDTQRYKTVESEREGINLDDSIDKKSQHPVSQEFPQAQPDQYLQELQNKINFTDQNQEDNDMEQEDEEEIVDHIKIENGEIIVSDSIAMNSSIPLDHINEILNGHRIDPKDMTNPQNQVDSNFNTPSGKQNFVFTSNVINAKDIREKANWRERAVDSDFAGMSKTTLSTQRPLMSGGAPAIGNLFHQNTTQSKLTSKGKLLSYQRGRFSSDSSFLKLRTISANNQGQPNKTNTNIHSKQIHKTNHQQPFGLKHSTVIDGEDSQCKFEGEGEREESCHHQHIGPNFNTQKIRGLNAQEERSSQFYRNSLGQGGQIGLNRLSWVNTGLKVSAVGIVGVGGVGQIQEEEEFVEDEESKRSHRNVTSIISEELSGNGSRAERDESVMKHMPGERPRNQKGISTMDQEGIQLQETPNRRHNEPGANESEIEEEALAGNSNQDRQKAFYHSDDSIVLSSSRIQTGGKEKGSNKIRYAEGDPSSKEESKCNLLNSNRTGADLYSSEKGDNFGLIQIKDPHHFLANSLEQKSKHQPNHNFPKHNTYRNQWLLDHDSEKFKYNLDSSPRSNYRRDEMLHSDDEIDIRRALEPSTNRSLNPREPELLRQSTHSLLGLNKKNQFEMGMDEDSVQMAGIGDKFLDYTNGQVIIQKAQRNNIRQDSLPLQMIVDDFNDDELRAQLDIDLQNQDLIQVIDDESDQADPPSRLVKLNLDSYDNFLKNADNFTARKTHY